MSIIVKIFYREDDILSYFMIEDYLNYMGITRTDLNIHYYMNELGLRSGL